MAQASPNADAGAEHEVDQVRQVPAHRVGVVGQSGPQLAGLVDGQRPGTAGRAGRAPDCGFPDRVGGQ